MLVSLKARRLQSIRNYQSSWVKEYFDINKLSGNVPKSAFMLVRTYQSLAKVSDIRIHINDERAIETSNCIKIYGYEH